MASCCLQLQQEPARHCATRSETWNFAITDVGPSPGCRCLQALLQRGMGELLATAGDGEAESWPR